MEEKNCSDDDQLNEAKKKTEEALQRVVAYEQTNAQNKETSKGRGRGKGSGKVKGKSVTIDGGVTDVMNKQLGLSAPSVLEDLTISEVDSQDVFVPDEEKDSKTIRKLKKTQQNNLLSFHLVSSRAS